MRREEQVFADHSPSVRAIIAATMTKKRLTISPDACTETLAVLIMMAWADGTLDEAEKDGVRAAASVLNLSKELRDRLETLMVAPIPVDELLFDAISPKDRSFAFVAAAWMSRVDRDVDSKESLLLDQLASMLGLSSNQKTELTQIADDLAPGDKPKSSWAEEIVTLFKSIPHRLEGGADDMFDVTFE